MKISTLRYFVKNYFTKTILQNLLKKPFVRPDRFLVSLV